MGGVGSLSFRSLTASPKTSDPLEIGPSLNGLLAGSYVTSLTISAIRSLGRVYRALPSTFDPTPEIRDLDQ